MEASGRAYGLRKRKRESRRSSFIPTESLLQAAETCSKVVIFTGSGLSAASGMSTFSSKGGLYERAQKRYRLSEGKKLFTYPFFERQKLDAQAFFAEIFEETKHAVPGKGHRALARIEESGKLQRHYTLNVDGLAEVVGLSTWHPLQNPEGKTVEMHGSIKQMVCPEPDCKHVIDMDDELMTQLKHREDIACQKCQCKSIRCRIMLYDDKDDDCITPDDVFEILEEDLEDADMILWVGISFEQSASTQYFRKAREFLLRAGRWKKCMQAIVNLSEDAHFNLLSACNNIEDITLLEVIGSSDDVLPKVAERMMRHPLAISATPSSSPAQGGSTEPMPGLEESVPSRVQSVASSPVPTDTNGDIRDLSEQDCLATNSQGKAGLNPQDALVEHEAA